MIAYSGKDPFVFVSYAHADWSEVEQIVIGLKRKMCRIWYDEGLTPGDSWNDDLARHIKECSCFIVFLSATSMSSPYVRSEINYAIAKGRKIIPVLLDRSEMPEGLEFALGTTQFATICDEDDPAKRTEMIAPFLPGEVFAPLLKPFLSSGGYDFYMEREDVFFESETYTGPDRCSNNLRITARTDEGDEIELFKLEQTFAYDVDYVVTQCSEITDDYYVGKIQGSYVVHILGKFELDYPLTGPDFDALMLLVLRIPQDEKPTVRLVDYQIVNLVQPVIYEGKKLTEAAWGSSIKKRLDAALAK